MNGITLSDMQDYLARIWVEHGPEAVWDKLHEGEHQNTASLIAMVNIGKRAQDFEQA